MAAGIRDRLREPCEVAKAHADKVDSEAIFPDAAVAAMRAAGLLAMAVPEPLGGLGAGFRDIAEACFALGRCCGSSALIFAMHQIQLGTLVRLAPPGSWHEQFVAHVARGQLLIASSTSETRPDEAARIGAREPGDEALVRVARACAAISYLEQADAVLLLAEVRAGGEATARPRMMVATSDQLVREKVAEWSGLGLRGSCTHSYSLRVALPHCQLLPQSFAAIDSGTLLPLAHCFLAACWTGMAAAAIAAAQEAVRANPLNAAGLLEALGRYELLRTAVRGAIGDAEAALAKPAEVPMADEVRRRLTLLKVTSSEAAAAIAIDCLKLAGLAGFQQHSPASVSRPLRDLLAAPIMISNRRILAENVGLSGIALDDTLCAI